MALNLNSLFGAQSNIGSQNIGSGQMAGAALKSAGVQGQTQPSLPVGSVISGQVVETKADSVTIRTDDGIDIQARMEDGVTLSKGSYVSFEVSGVSDSQVALKALFTNTAAGSSTMSAALSQAQIPETAQSFGMVRSMMENGMPIDKNSLLSMYRQVTGHPQAPAESIVDMAKLGLPLTDENINQFEAYRNLEHQITRTVDTVTESMQTALDELVRSGDTDKALGFIKDVAQFLSKEEGALQGTENAETLTEDGGVRTKEAAPPAVGEAAAGSGEAGQTKGPASLSENAFIRLIDTAIEEEQALVKEGQEGQITGDAPQKSDAPGDPMAALMKALSDAGSRIEEASQKPEGAKIVITEQENAVQADGKSSVALSDLTKDMPQSEVLREVAKGLSELLSQEKTPENAARLQKAMTLLQGRELKEMLSESLGKQWRMEPRTVAQKEDVQAFYEKLRNQTGKLAQTIANTLGKENPLYEQVTNIRQNVEFMNELNHTASYVQLPLKLSGENAHGDLYVYTNKKNLAAEDGKVSAFLHLDMDHLGPVDVYVAMENTRVSTNFYLRDDGMIDFISENIHILNERLNDRGYNMSCQVTRKEDPTPANVLEEIVEDHRDGFLIGSKSFDVRA